MRKIKAVRISNENFRAYGEFTDMLNPKGNCFPGGATFYPDQLMLCPQAGKAIAFSPLTVEKPDQLLVTQAEYHTHTAECILPLDDDAIIHVAPPSNHTPVPEKTEAFIVPKGTLVRLNTGVWHLAPLPVNNALLHVMIVLPERVYANDCTVCTYPEDQQIEIEL